MKTAVILHGVCDNHEYFEMDFPSPSNAHWIPWLQQKFLRNGILCQTLEMPTPYDPNYEQWKNTFDAVHLNADSIIVGHSAGCGFILKWLHQNLKVKISKLVLVAPWLDPAQKYGNFLTFELNSEIQDNIRQIHICYSTNEPVSGVSQSKDMILKAYPKAQLHQFADKGHFCFKDTGLAFNDLWDICLSNTLRE